MTKYKIMCCYEKKTNEFIRCFLISDIIISTISIGSPFSIIFLIIASVCLFRINKTNNYKDDILKFYGVMKLIFAIVYIIGWIAIIVVFGMGISGWDKIEEGAPFFSVILSVLIPIYYLIIVYTQLNINFYKATQELFNDKENENLELTKENLNDKNIKDSSNDKKIKDSSNDKKIKENSNDKNTNK